MTVAAAYGKRRRQDTLPLRADLAPHLRAHLAARHPNAPAFRMPKGRKAAAAMFRADVEAAGIAYRDGAGLVADFHSLIHKFADGVSLGAAG